MVDMGTFQRTQNYKIIMYKLIKHPITNQVSMIQRLSDTTFIPMVEDNKDYQAYLKWVSEGNTPEPAEE
jgi:hypothetical protein